MSVIVPIYKVEDYLKRCIESLVNQTYKNIEIILVDDGSPDNCGAICDDYSLKYNRIRVIHKENGGLSDARNYGLVVAQGEYILFVDSDDFIELDAIEKMILFAKENHLDIICGDSYRTIVNESNSIVNRTKMFGGTIENKVFTGEEYVVDCISKKKFSVTVCTRMYRTDLIKENNLYFKKDLLHEDENWTPRVLLAAKRVVYINMTFYHYLIRKNSITQIENRKKHVEDVLSTCNELIVEYNIQHISELNKKILKDYLARLYINTSTYGKYEKNFYTKVIDKKFPLRNAYFLKTRIESIVYAVSISLYRYLKLKFS
ncbi:glycosyltransferase [Psychrobacillus sp. FSL H8-0510]|uniref:glycosyltransferase n=1 Tax=Psychrobacillus sp. FSL H8-0510 TaxID=2921394 RepID=UPI0030FCE38B